MADTYEFEKSQQVQDLDHETPLKSSQWQWIPDLNQGNYQFGGQSLIQFDASSIYNSDKFISPEMYLAIPVQRVACFSTANSATAIAITEAVTVGYENFTSMKAGSWNLINSMEVVVDGRTIIQNVPNINWYNNFRMLSQLSPADIASYGPSLGIACIDDVVSYKYNGLSNLLQCGGNGLRNNNIYPASDITGVLLNTSVAVGMNAPSSGTAPVPLSVGTFNQALFQRNISSNIGGAYAATTAGVSNLYGGVAGLSVMSLTNLANEFKSNFQIVNNYCVWTDTAIVRLKDICPFFEKLPLTKSLNMMLRIYVNTGVVGAQMALNAGTGGNLSMSGANTTFTNTCPFMINNLTVASPATTAQFVAGLFISKVVTTSMLSVNLATSGASAHPMNSCRLYYNLVEPKINQMIRYVENNRAKKILYKNTLFQNCNNVSSASTYSQLIQSGVTRITGVLLIPFFSASTHGLVTAITLGTASVTTSFHPAISPFDTAPITTPMSLTQLNVAIAGVNQSQNFYNYSYENFLQQVSLYDKINSSDLGLSCGLINQQSWELGYRYYYIDCSRYTDATANVPRNVTVTFYNNTLQTLDVACFVEYLSENVINVETGRIQ